MNKKYKFLVTYIDADSGFQTRIKTGVASKADVCPHDPACEDKFMPEGNYELHARRNVIHDIVKDGGYVKSITKYEGKEEGLAGA